MWQGVERRWVLRRPRRHAMLCVRACRPRLHHGHYYRGAVPVAQSSYCTVLYSCCSPRARHDDGSGSLAVPNVRACLEAAAHVRLCCT